MSIEKHVLLAFPTVYWSHNWERQHELIYQYAKKTGYDIFIFPPFGYINHGIKSLFKKIIKKKIERTETIDTKNPKLDNIHFLYSIFFIPYHNINFIRKLNKIIIINQIKKKYPYVWDKIADSEPVIVFATYSTDTVLDLIDFIKPSSIIVDIAQRRKYLKQVPKYALEFEEELIRRANILFSDSVATCEDYKEIKEIFYFCQGVSIEKFLYNNKININEMECINKPIVGYIGALHQAIDYDILEYAIIENSDLEFVFIGNIVDNEANRLMKYNNVKFLGRKSYTELPSYMQYFNVGIVPYKMNEFNDGVSPTKLFEYGIMKIPILSTNIKEVAKYGRVIKIASTKEEFSNMIRSVVDLSGPKLSNLKEELYNLSLDNSWEKKFNFFYEKIIEMLNKGDGVNCE